MRDEIHLRFSINLAKKDDDKDDKNGDKKNNNNEDNKNVFSLSPKERYFFLRSYVVRVGKSVCPACCEIYINEEY